MKRILHISLAVGLVAVILGCDSRTEKTDGGGVLLTVTNFDGLPVTFAVNAGGLVQIGSLDIENRPKDPTGATSGLMDVEIVSYEVSFTRADTGTRIPPIFVRGIFGVAPVNGNLTYDNLPIADLEQFGHIPLSDLLFENGGFDRETGQTTILVNCRLRFFGRTLSGDEVETAPAIFTVRFTP